MQLVYECFYFISQGQSNLFKISLSSVKNKRLHTMHYKEIPATKMFWNILLHCGFLWRRLARNLYKCLSGF